MTYPLPTTNSSSTSNSSSSTTSESTSLPTLPSTARFQGCRCSFCGTSLDEVAYSHLLGEFTCLNCYSRETAVGPPIRRAPLPKPPPLALTFFEVKALLSATGYEPSRATAKRKLKRALEEAT